MRKSIEHGNRTRSRTRACVGHAFTPPSADLARAKAAGKISHRNRQTGTDATNRRKQSMRLICEAKLRLANAPYAIEHAIKDLTIHCRSISQNSGQYELDFEVATATIRAHEEGLLIRVEAEETVISHGTKMLIASQISAYAINMPMNIMWVDATEEPLANILAPKKLETREN